MVLNRSIHDKSYRYGFQGQEKDDETGLVNYKYRMHDPRVGRFFAVDPLTSKYPHNGPYNFSENRVIDGIELEGLEVFLIHGDVRGSFLLTGSVSKGIIFDMEGNVGWFESYGGGIGVAAGGSVGAGVSVYSADNITELAGWGASLVLSGGVLGVAGVSVDASVDTDLDGSDNTSSVGGTAGVSGGAEIVIAGELTYTWVTPVHWGNMYLEILDDADGDVGELKDFRDNITEAKDDLTTRIHELALQHNSIMLKNDRTEDETKEMNSLSEKIATLNERKGEMESTVQKLDTEIKKLE